MGKNQGVATGLVMAAALMLRPTAPPPTSQAQPSTATGADTAPPALTEPRDGPWMASCNYWSPVRPAAPQLDRDPEISGTMGQLPVKLHLDFPEFGKQEQGCVPGKIAGHWGFPDNLAEIHVTALIALVPDPVHTHFGLTFDRTIDALLQAGADNDYVPGYFW